MVLTEEQKKQFEEVVRPLMKWIAETNHPYLKAIITNDSAEILESSATVIINDYIPD